MFHWQLSKLSSYTWLNASLTMTPLLTIATQSSRALNYESLNYKNWEWSEQDERHKR
jgi:hypothetical protein